MTDVSCKDRRPLLTPIPERCGQGSRERSQIQSLTQNPAGSEVSVTHQPQGSSPSLALDFSAQQLPGVSPPPPPAQYIGFRNQCFHECLIPVQQELLDVPPDVPKVNSPVSPSTSAPSRGWRLTRGLGTTIFLGFLRSHSLFALVKRKKKTKQNPRLLVFSCCGFPVTCYLWISTAKSSCPGQTSASSSLD